MARPPDKPRFTAAPSARVYDAIVLGPSLGGAFAAALLARRGLRVLWAEHGSPPAAYAHQGFLWPTRALPLPLPRAVPPLEDALTELGLTTQVSRALRPVVPALQLVLPRHRLDLPLDDARRLAECTREFGKSGARVAELVKQLAAAHTATDGFLRTEAALPPSGLLARWRLRRALQAWPALRAPSPLSESEPAESLLSRAAAFLVYQAGDSPLAVQRSLSQLLAGPQRFPGRQAGLLEVLRHRFEELGGTLLPVETVPGSGVQALSVEGGQPVGLDVRGSEASHRAAFLLSALDDVELLALLPESLRTAKPTALRPPVPTQAVLSVHWVLPAAALPQGLGELVLADDASALGAFLVQVGPARRLEARGDEPALRLATGTAVVPPDVEPGLVAGHAARIEEALERLMPFASAQRLARSVPQLDAPRRIPGLVLHPLLPQVAKAPWEGVGLSPTTAWPTLLRAGREVCPGLGFEGELLAALGAVARVQRATQKRRPRR
ncbi:MAG: desaturase [Myxococcaceae bacterium]